MQVTSPRGRAFTDTSQSISSPESELSLNDDIPVLSGALSSLRLTAAFQPPRLRLA